MCISLIMATVDRTESIYVFLQSLHAQISQAFELIIIDQNHDGRLEPIIRNALSKGISITHLKHPIKSISAARNMGISIAKYDILGFPDDDCTYEPNLIHEVIEFFKKDPHSDGITVHWAEQKDTKPVFHQHDSRSWRRFRMTSGSSITVFLRKDLLKSNGGFDESLGLPQWFGSGEETDLIMRCLDQGAKIHHLPNISVHHAIVQNPPCFLMFHCHQIRHRARGTGAIFCKHHLSFYVILRGIIGPVLLSFSPPFSLCKAIGNVFQSLGRIEGFLKWKKLYTNR